jgi:hypothetical protein
MNLEELFKWRPWPPGDSWTQFVSIEQLDKQSRTRLALVALELQSAVLTAQLKAIQSSQEIVGKGV